MSAEESPLTRAELVQILRNRLSVSSRDANRIIETALGAISEVLAGKGSISLSGLGRFQVKLTPARPGRNPKTGTYAEVPTRYRPTFTMSRHLRERMMECGEGGAIPDSFSSAHESEPEPGDRESQEDEKE